mmetsp:Transcript_101869/g.185976  ORF Transcript_101869/g.185976 Transcript_101869/m.185976 type:complete len:600 (+) Transcript_101869:108-1907(+)
MTVTVIAEPFRAATDASFAHAALLPMPSAKAAALRAKVAAFQGTAISTQEPCVAEMTPRASEEEGECAAQEHAASEKAAAERAAAEKEAAERDAAEKVSHLHAWLTLEPEALRADLHSMKVSKIRARAVLLGATEDELDDVYEVDSPKLALIELVVEKTVANQASKAGALDDDSPGSLGMVQRQPDAYEKRGKARTDVVTEFATHHYIGDAELKLATHHFIGDVDSAFCLDGLWVHQGAPVARVAGSDLHWLTGSRTVSQLVLISDGVWSMEMDGEHYTAEASRQISDMHLFWNDGEVWTKCNQFAEDFQSSKESAQLALEDLKLPEESAQVALSSKPTVQAIKGGASKTSVSEAFLDALEEDINVTSKELAPFLQEHEALAEVIDIAEKPSDQMEEEAWVLQVRQDHGKPTSHFNIGDIVETTRPLIVRRGETLGSLQLGQLPSNTRLRVAKIGTARTGRRLEVSALRDTEFRPPEQCPGDPKFWPTRMMRENQSGWISAVAHDGLELLRVVRHAGEGSSVGGASASTAKQPNVRQRLAAAPAAMEQLQMNSCVQKMPPHDADLISGVVNPSCLSLCVASRCSILVSLNLQLPGSIFV